MLENEEIMFDELKFQLEWLENQRAKIHKVQKDFAQHKLNEELIGEEIQQCLADNAKQKELIDKELGEILKTKAEERELRMEARAAKKAKFEESLIQQIE